MLHFSTITRIDKTTTLCEMKDKNNYLQFHNKDTLFCTNEKMKKSLCYRWKRNKAPFQGHFKQKN